MPGQFHGGGSLLESVGLLVTGSSVFAVSTERNPLWVLASAQLGSSFSLEAFFSLFFSYVENEYLTAGAACS